MSDHTEITAPVSVFLDMDLYGEWGLSSMFRRDESETQYIRADLVAASIADAERRGREAGLVEAANLASMWFQFNSQGEPTGGYCTVEAHDPGGMVRYIKRDAIIALRTSPDTTDNGGAA